jgi:hypothetical protein
LHINTTTTQLQNDDGNDSNTGSNDNTSDEDEKENIPLTVTDEDLSMSVLYKLIKAAKCTGFPRLKALPSIKLPASTEDHVAQCL